MLAPWAGRGLAGIGVGGDETAVDPSEFVGAFRRARGLGLRTTVHAGESAGADSVRAALAALGPDRVGHGFRAVEDTELMARLGKLDIALEVCPSSNVATGVAASWRSHPLRLLYDAGVPVTINSDDGAFFGTDVRREVRMASRELLFTRKELMGMMRTAARVAFLAPRERRRLERRIRAAWDQPRNVLSSG
jgi:adenosine deaminase